MFDRIGKSVAIAVVFLAASVLAAPKVAIVAHDPGYYTSLARHAGRWLKGEGIDSSVVAPSGMKESLASAKVAFAIGFAEPTAVRDRAALTACCDRFAESWEALCTQEFLSQFAGMPAQGSPA